MHPSTLLGTGSAVSPPVVSHVEPPFGIGAHLFAFLVVLLCFFVLLLLWFPFLHWTDLFSHRAIRSMLRGGLQYVFGRRGQRRVHGWRIFYRLRVEVALRSIRQIQGTLPPRVRIWVDREAFPRIRRLIRRAHHTIFIQMFIWKDDRLGRQIAKTLVEAADRGVRVEISKEAVGDLFEFHKDFLSTRESAELVWKRFWSHPRIRISYGTRNDHAKVFVIDERILLLTGMNIADEYHERWHDYMVELRGRSFVEHYLTEGAIPGRRPEARIIMNAGHRKEIRTAAMDLIASAGKTIVLEQSYFADPAVTETLIRRSHDGVRIILILPSQVDFHYYTNMQSVSSLLAKGDQRRISIFLYPGMVHGKILLVDRERAFLGSANLTTSSLDEMGEVNVLLDGRGLRAVRKLRHILREDVLRSTVLTRPPRFQWVWRWLTWLKL